MYESSQLTIIKTRYTPSNLNSLNASSRLERKVNQNDECLTPILKINKEEFSKANLLRKSDRHISIDHFQVEAAIKDKNVKQENQKLINNQAYQTPIKFNIPPQSYFSSPTIKNAQQARQTFDPKSYTLKQKQQTLEEETPGEPSNILIISSNFQTYTELIEQPDELPNNNEALKLHINKAKQVHENLKNENLKLRLEKIKLTSKKNDDLKIIPLKIELQNLKKNIQMLTKQKELLEAAQNLTKKETFDGSQVKNSNPYYQPKVSGYNSYFNKIGNSKIFDAKVDHKNTSGLTISNFNSSFDNQQYVINVNSSFDTRQQNNEKPKLYKQSLNTPQISGGIIQKSTNGPTYFQLPQQNGIKPPNYEHSSIDSSCIRPQIVYKQPFPIGESPERQVNLKQYDNGPRITYFPAETNYQNYANRNRVENNGSYGLLGNNSVNPPVLYNSSYSGTKTPNNNIESTHSIYSPRNV